MTSKVIQVRPLSHADLEDVFREEWLQKPQHMYLLHNLLVALGRVEDERESFQCEFYGAFSAEGMEGFMVLRSGFSFVLGESSEGAGASFAPILLASPIPPRLGIGPPSGMDALIPKLGRRMAIRFDRSQPFMAIQRGGIKGRGKGLSTSLRKARIEDVDWLVRANLTLNHEDLQFDPRFIHMGKLRERISGRVKRGETWILEAAGTVVSKLDVGFESSAGALIEGVFTAPEWRGKGMGTQLVASLCQFLLGRAERVGLHHARENIAARKAYQAAGFREIADLRLVLFG
jgi:GNAT superfamily N-acetyltransferase